MPQYCTIIILAIMVTKQAKGYILKVVLKYLTVLLRFATNIFRLKTTTNHPKDKSISKGKIMSLFSQKLMTVLEVKINIKPISIEIGINKSKVFLEDFLIQAMSLRAKASFKE